MKIKFIAALSLFLGAAFIYSCEDKRGVIPVMVTTGGGSTPLDTINMTFSSSTDSLHRMRPIINADCGTSNTSCHSPGRSTSTFDYTNYSVLYTNYQNGTLYSGLFGALHNMPASPQPPLDNLTKAKFKAWIDQGCPQ